MFRTLSLWDLPVDQDVGGLVCQCRQPGPEQTDFGVIALPSSFASVQSREDGSPHVMGSQHIHQSDWKPCWRSVWVTVHGHESALSLDDHVVGQAVRVKLAPDETDVYQTRKPCLQVVGEEVHEGQVLPFHVLNQHVGVRQCCRHPIPPF